MVELTLVYVSDSSFYDCAALLSVDHAVAQMPDPFMTVLPKTLSAQ